MTRAVLLAVLLAACAPAASPSTMSLRTPRALTSCAQPPAELQARLWISGSDVPCFLDVDVDKGTTTGACEAAPGIERRFTLDWFIDVGGREVVLAQAQQDIDLSGQQDDVSLSVKDDDVVVDGCKDMSVDSFNGNDTVDVDGEDVPVCDLDGDGDANIVEVCAGGDPLGGV